jgi:GTPase SAR1 family protein
MSGIDAIVDCADRLGRDDVVETLRVAVDRARRAETFVVVMGEFKQGKSSLVNALVGRWVCPDDDDTATAVITMVEPAGRDGATTVSDGVAHPIDAVASADVICGRVDGPAVDHVRLEVERARLPAGLVMIDTPGVGGLEGGHTIATLAFLPYADAVLFVSDATAEYSAAEISWLQRARATGTRIIPVLTKADLAPAWRRVLELDRAHLDRHDLSAPIVVTSAALHQLAIDVGDPELERDSGIPALRRLLIGDVVDPARTEQEHRATITARRMARLLAEQLRVETELLGDRVDAASAEAEQARRRLEHLRGPAAKWQQRLTDRIGDITNASTFGFRASMRSIGQSIDARVDELESPTDWTDFAESLQFELAEAATGAFVDIDTQFAALRQELFELVAQPAPSVSGTQWTVERPAVDQLLTAATSSAGQGGTTLTAVRGAQSGVMLFGFLGQLLPAAAGALLLSSPITLVLGGAFAGKALLDVRKRSLTVRRTQLKTAARKVLDDAQFELGNRVSDHVRTSGRALRDEVSGALAMALRTDSDAMANATRLTEVTGAERTARLAELRAIASDLRTADAALAGSR